jgi:hypothetical protein
LGAHNIARWALNGRNDYAFCIVPRAERGAHGRDRLEAFQNSGVRTTNSSVHLVARGQLRTAQTEACVCRPACNQLNMKVTMGEPLSMGSRVSLDRTWMRSASRKSSFRSGAERQTISLQGWTETSFAIALSFGRTVPNDAVAPVRGLAADASTGLIPPVKEDLNQTPGTGMDGRPIQRTKTASS